MFSQDRVEKASGEIVVLREYLEEVWAAVAREALSLMFEELMHQGWKKTLGLPQCGCGPRCGPEDQAEDAKQRMGHG